MRTSATTRVRPRPSESTTDGGQRAGPVDVADGEAEARSSAGAARAGQAAMTPTRDEAEEDERRRRRDDEDDRDAPVEGKADRKAQARATTAPAHHEIGGPRRAAYRRHLVAEERRRADLARPAEREEREGERGQRRP